MWRYTSTATRWWTCYRRRPTRPFPCCQPTRSPTCLTPTSVAWTCRSRRCARPSSCRWRTLNSTSRSASTHPAASSCTARQVSNRLSKFTEPKADHLREPFGHGTEFVYCVILEIIHPCLVFKWVFLIIFFCELTLPETFRARPIDYARLNCGIHVTDELGYWIENGGQVVARRCWPRR